VLLCLGLSCRIAPTALTKRIAKTKLTPPADVKTPPRPRQRAAT